MMHCEICDTHNLKNKVHSVCDIRLSVRVNIVINHYYINGIVTQCSAASGTSKANISIQEEYNHYSETKKKD